jgi:hypothetical protein
VAHRDQHALAARGQGNRQRRRDRGLADAALAGHEQEAPRLDLVDRPLLASGTDERQEAWLEPAEELFGA